MADLLDAVDFSAVEALNQQPGHSLQNALKQARHLRRRRRRRSALRFACTLRSPSLLPSLGCRATGKMTDCT